MVLALAARLTNQFLLDPTPNHPVPGNVDLPGLTGTKLGILMGWGLRVFWVLAFFGFLMAAGKMLMAHRRGEEANFSALGITAVACLIGGSAGAIVDALLY
jgi:hypothetical protein